MDLLFYGRKGARTHDLPRVRRTLSRLSYTSILFAGKSVFSNRLNEYNMLRKKRQEVFHSPGFRT